MTKNYNEYLEAIKRKLDDLNKAQGFNPELNQQILKNEMPSNDIFDMLGNGAKLWMEKQKNQK